MNFQINELERNLDGGVLTAHWQAYKSSGEYTASSYGAVDFDPDTSAEGFIPYEDLTEEVVIEWVKDTLNLETLEETLDNDLLQQEQPTILTGIPWE